jgi:hypothetical protein
MIPLLLQVTPSAASLGFWLSAAGNVALVVTVIVLLVRKSQPIEIDKQPVHVTGRMKVEPQPGLATQAECELRHADISRRLDGHDHEIESLWTTMRAEDKATREILDERFQAIQRALGRIEGKIDQAST